jgi:hypothetical protein
MDKNEAIAERARLQKLLDAYEAGRPTQEGEHGRGSGPLHVAPDRAGNVRVRIARLDQLITESKNDQTPYGRPPNQ